MENECAYAYILANHHRTVLYVGSTANLKKRIYLHRNSLIPGFTNKITLRNWFTSNPSLIGLQPSVDREKVLLLKNRRSGIEPLICHVKEFGLRKSKMRSDQAKLSSGYRCVIGFNLHQMIKYLDGNAA